MESFPISQISIGGARLRPVDEKKVEALAESIKTLGLINPICLFSTEDGSDVRLIAGQHRLEAAKRLGWSEIEAHFVDERWTEDEARLAEIDENLIRNELSDSERIQHLAERKKLLEALGQARKHGRPSHAEKEPKLGSFSDKSFANQTAEVTGRSNTAITRDITRANKVAPDVLTDIQGTKMDKGVEIDALAKLPTHEQHAAVSAVQSGQAQSVRTFIAAQTPKPDTIEDAIEADSNKVLAAFVRLRPLAMERAYDKIVAHWAERNNLA